MSAALSSLEVSSKHGRRDICLVIAAGLIAFAGAMKMPLYTWAVFGLEKSISDVSSWAYYNISFLSANYFDDGFIRRGLAGTITNSLSTNPYLAGFLFHVFSAVFLIVPFGLLQLRLLRKLKISAALFMMVFVVLSPQTFLAWAYDIARTDMLVIGLLAWAVIAMLANRPLVAGAALIVGFLIHETAIIFGAPLLLVIAVAQARGNEISWIRLARALGIFVGSLGLIVIIQGMATPSIEEFAASMMRNTPHPISQWHRDLRDCAIYMMVMGMRGLKTAICYNFYWEGYGVMMALSLVVCIANGVALGLERIAWGFALAILAPVIFMDAVANDLGRWVKFACASAWLLSAVFQLKGTINLSGRRLAVNYAILGALIYCGTSPVHTVNRASESIVRRLGLAGQPEVSEWMTHCDPEWRKAVGDFGDGLAKRKGLITSTVADGGD